MKKAFVSTPYKRYYHGKQIALANKTNLEMKCDGTLEHV